MSCNSSMFQPLEFSLSKKSEKRRAADVAAGFDQLPHLRDMKTRHGHDADFVRRQAWV